MALFAVHVSSPAIIFLTTLSLLYMKPFPSPSPSPITPVVVQSRFPRTTLILVFLSLSALSFLIDGLAYITYAVFNRAWSLGTGIPLASVLGLVAYAGLAAILTPIGACIGERVDAVLESAYVVHLSGLLLGNSGGLRVKGSLYRTGAVSRLLEAMSVALGALIVLSVYVVSIVLSRTLSLCTVPYSSSRVYPAFALFTLVQALIACGGLLLGSPYVAQGVVDGIWSVGGWVAWVWYWVAIIDPLPTWNIARCSLRARRPEPTH
ncbi:hypothetical protein EDD15DRAFT_2516821 [Pisolithus albus]|nr:hypothetical protein EDD15DRAFT_2516821 [Pisolithus albus]